MKKNIIFPSLAAVAVGALITGNAFADTHADAAEAVAEGMKKAEEVADKACSGDKGCSGDKQCSGDKECSGDKKCSGDKECSGDKKCSGDKDCSGDK